MCADLSSDLSAPEIASIRDALAAKVNGRFEFVLYREDESDSQSDSD
jgi:hypothetical protein